MTASVGTIVIMPRDAADDGAELAVAALFRTHFWTMVRLARQLVDDQHTAEDVAQEAFLALHRQWAAMRDPDRALTYVRSAVLNLARSRTRRAIVRRRYDRLEPSDTAAPADAPLLARTEQDRMRAALDRLPRRQREVLVLRYWSELSEDEIARTLGISRGSVKTHASRGLRALERHLGSEDER